MDLKDLLAKLHEELATELRNRLKAEDVTAADLNVIRQFLKDNAISGVPTASNPLGKLVQDMPFSTPSDQDDKLYN